MYEQIAANKRKTVLLIFLFVLLLSRGRARGRLLPARRRRRHRRSSRSSSIVSSFVSYFNSDKVALRDGAREAGRPGSSTPATTTSSKVCASRAGCPKPRLYIVDDPAPNAFSTGRNPKHAAVAVTTGLLEKMNRVELEGVLAHELSHIRNYDILVMTLAVTMVGIIALLSDFFLRIMFWTGGRGGRDDNNNNPLGIVFAILGLRAVDLRPDHRGAHADRGQPQA